MDYNETTNMIASVFHKHPIMGAIISLSTPIIGRLVPVMLEVHIPTIYMQIIQITVWTIGGLVGLLTIKGLLKKDK